MRGDSVGRMLRRVQGRVVEGAELRAVQEGEAGRDAEGGVGVGLPQG